MRATAKAATVATGGASTTKTLLQIQAGTNHKLKLTEVGISFNGVDNLAEPILVELVRQTTTGTASSLTILKSTPEDSGTIDASAQETFTVEPTTTDIIRAWYIHPQSGLIYNPPDPKEFTVDSAGRLALRTTVPSGGVTVNAQAHLEFDE